LSTINIQPKEIKKLLEIKSEKDYDLVLKAYKLLFDLLCYAKDGSSFVTGMVTWVKCSDDEIVVSNGKKSVVLKVKPETQPEVLFQELAEAVGKSFEIILPV